MFDKYNEKARRVVFFARYEASEDGSPCIETEHILLGVCRECRGLMARMLGSEAATESLEQKFRQRRPRGPKTSTSVDLALSKESQRVLAYAAEEAERLAHKHIGAEHLVLGLLREKECEAAHALMESGLRTARAREIASGGPEVTSLEMVHHTSGELLETWPLQALVPVPRIGEQVLLRDSQHSSRLFRVVSVTYEFDRTRLEKLRLSLEPLPSRPQAEGP